MRDPAERFNSILLEGVGMNSVESLLQCSDHNLRLRLAGQLNQLRDKLVGSRILDIQCHVIVYQTKSVREL